MEEVHVFECSGDQLLGVLHRPAGADRGVAVLFVVGGPQYRVGSHRQFVQLARHMASLGCHVLRFDVRGMGDSDGRPRSFEELDDDIGAAAKELLRHSPPQSRLVLFGLCDGASAALMYSRKDDRVRGLIIANPWVRTQQGAARAVVKHYYRGRLLERSFWMKLLGGGIHPGRTMREMVRMIRASRFATPAVVADTFIDRMLVGLRRLQGPVLLILSGRDLTAREFEDHCGASTAWREALNEERISTVHVRDTNHTFAEAAGRASVEAAVAQWLAKLP